MTKTANVLVQDLSKIFPRHQRSKVKGVSTDGISALYYLLKKTLISTNKPILSASGESNCLFALNKINFNVEPGEVLGIIGRNGAGKSTLLKILGRVLNPSAGKIILRGRVMSMLELGVGFAPDLTVRENIQIQGRLSGFNAKQISAVEDDILHFSELENFRDIPLEKCPSGSFAQLGFAAMLNFKVNIILADEVLAVGDSRFQRACEDRVLLAKKSGESVLFVSHDMNAIKRVCSRVIWMDQGKIVQAGPVESVVKAYTRQLLTGSLTTPTSAEISTNCRLLDFRLLNINREPIGAFHITEPGYIDCLLRISQPHIIVTIQIQLWQHTHCLFSVEKSCTLTELNASTFSVGIKLPGNLLNESAYQARCRLYARNIYTEENIDENLLVGEERLSFSVINSRPTESVWKNWAWGRPGLISPKLSWTVKLEPVN